MTLAKNIRYLRKKQGWGQDTLADKLGYKSYTTIQKWESGVSEPPLKTVHVLADLFHVDINDLTGIDLEMAPTESSECHDSNHRHNIIRIAGRDGSYQEKNLSDEDLAALKVLLDRLPDACDDL